MCPYFSKLLFIIKIIMAVTESTFAEEGKRIINRGKRNAEWFSMRNFKAHFGASPAVCFDLWSMIDPIITMGVGALPVHLLWALMLMKVYATEHMLTSQVGASSEKVFRKWAWRFIAAIEEVAFSIVSVSIISLAPNFTSCRPHYSLQIDLNDRFQNNVGNLIKLSVDCTDCPIEEPRNPWSKSWYSKKLNRAGLKYEIGMNIMTGQFCWVNGPFKAARHDVTIF